MNNMNKFQSYSGFLTWSAALLLSVLAAGCGGGGGDGGRDPILGTPGIGAFVVPPVPPTVTAVTPLANATAVPINTKIITAAFSKAMNPATLTATSFTLECPVGTPVPPVAGSPTYLAAGNVATLTLPALPNLPPSTVCRATVTTEAQDTTGIPLASNFVWIFTTGITPDTTRPTVTLTIPANAAVGVATNTAITAVFSEEMAPATITAAGTFTVTCAAPCVSPVGAAVTYVVGSRTAVFTPAAALATNQLYTATITAAATDLAGPPNTLLVPAVLPVPNPWTFTTAAAPDTTAPVISSTNPANGAAAVLVTQRAISATFTEPMNPATFIAATFTVTCTAPCALSPVPGTVSYDAINNIATFTANADLAPGATYNATITAAATDLAGRPLVVPQVLPVPDPWSFTVPAIVVPPVAVIPVVLLRSAAPFGAFGGTAGMTNSGILTVINGDIGTTAVSTNVTGYHDVSVAYTPPPPVPGAGCTYTETGSNIGFVNGTIYTAPPPPTVACPLEGTPATLAIATQARLDADTAFIALERLPGGIDVGTGELGGRTLAPGVYKSAPGTYAIQAGDLTLDAGGDPNAFWVFQMATSLTVGGPALGPRSVILTGGAQAKNIFWQVGSSATINGIIAGGTMEGTIIARDQITFSTAGQVNLVRLNGRALSLGAGVVLNNTLINVPAP